MAGGIGSRFWPASTESTPKQFLDILGTGKSLLQQTVDRFEPIVGMSNILILTNERYQSMVKEQLPAISRDQIICEPARRNTAPCILYAAIKIWKQSPKASIIVSPSDHIISEAEEFERAINLGLETLKNQPENTITLGIKPTNPATGFGYIKKQHMVSNGIYSVEKFIEKPNLQTATKMLESDTYYWNSGLFMWNVQHLKSLYQENQPQMLKLFEDELEVFNTENEEAAVNKLYPKCENISVDYAILERANNVLVIPGGFGWSDLGAWSSLRDHAEKDSNGNIVIGSEQTLLKESSDNITVLSKNKKVIIEGLENYIVVDTDEALLICPIDNEQSIKNHLAELNTKTKNDEG